MPRSRVPATDATSATFLLLLHRQRLRLRAARPIEVVAPLDSLESKQVRHRAGQVPKAYQIQPVGLRSHPSQSTGKQVGNGTASRSRIDRNEQCKYFTSSTYLAKLVTYATQYGRAWGDSLARVGSAGVHCPTGQLMGILDAPTRRPLQTFSAYIPIECGSRPPIISRAHRAHVISRQSSCWACLSLLGRSKYA